MLTTLQCLVVDDDETKRARISQALIAEIGGHAVQVAFAASAHEAVELLRLHAYDLFVVDVNLPLRAGEPPSRDGGTKLLKQIGRATGSLIRPAFVVGITGFSDLAAAATPEFTAHGWALLSYSPESAVWEEALATHCQHIYSYKSRIDATSGGHAADICLLTALADTELEAVRNLPCDFKTVIHPRDQARYFEGQIRGEGRSLRVVATSAVEMGNAAIAAAASKAVALYRPKVCVMVGICAGIEASIGDLAVADFSLHYESGKYKEGEEGEAVFHPQPLYQPSSERLLEAVRRYKLDHASQILALPAFWPADKPANGPVVHVGPVASGAAVVENKAMVADLKFRDRKLIGLEMESYGFYHACRHSVQPKPEFIMIKGVCDKAKPPKVNKYQRYSAFLSARFAYELLLAELLVPGGLFS